MGLVHFVESPIVVFLTAVGFECELMDLNCINCLVLRQRWSLTRIRFIALHLLGVILKETVPI